ncbi:MAG: RNA polymerase factor sigma-54 [Dysgonamonadaceae bacterium]|jgi:RNA polymerase sigma-54 factor|nr:RNA polymerase factor sigma-54 [Dysgonamonadaceae bacterium]
MLKQNLQQKLIQKLSPLQIQTIKLLELPLIQLEERIKKELEENPVLEEEDVNFDDQTPDTIDSNDDEFTLEDYIEDDIPNYKTSVNNNSRDEPKEYSTMSNSVSLQQLLEEQLAFHYLNNREHTLGLFIIGSIDNDGYLRRDLLSITDDIAFKMGMESTAEELEEILKIIQTFDPPGVGARTLKECLLIQLKNKEQTNEIKAAKLILDECFDEFSKKHYSKIILKLNIGEDLLRDSVHEILKLNPKPGTGYENMYTEQAQQIIPDFILEYKNGEAELSLNSHDMPELKVNKDYSEIIDNYASKDNPSQDEKDTVNFVKQKIDSAKWFIDSLKQRQQTLLSTMWAIMKFQNEYFKTGDESNLRPMILKDIAERTGLDVSTVSRVVNSKYVQCDWGIFSLRFFFSEGIQSKTGEVSTREVKKIIVECINNENKVTPLTDEELKVILKNKGYVIARRTVAKYREKMNIPVARLRKEL